MILRQHKDSQYLWKKLQKSRFVRYNARYGQIHIGPALLDDFGIEYGQECYVLFANDEATGEWYITLTQDKEMGGFHLIQSRKSQTQRNALMCQRRTFTRLLAQEFGTDAMKCPVSQKAIVQDEIKWYKLLTSINLIK